MNKKIRISSRKRIRTCGFRKRLETRGGRKVLSRRRSAGKKSLAVAKYQK